MRKIKHEYLIWGAAALIYAVFFIWYTNLAGPLTQTEISLYMEKAEARNFDPEQLNQLRRFMQQDQGDDFLMVNIIHMKDKPDQIKGVAPSDTAQQVLDRYMEFMWPQLLQRASHPAIWGAAVANAMDIQGFKDNSENARVWTQGALMRYRSRRDLLEISMNPIFRERHPFKIAAMQKTIAFPIEAPFNLGDPRFVLALLLLVIAALGHLLILRSSSNS